jgi:hypothetical protein
MDGAIYLDSMRLDLVQDEIWIRAPVKAGRATLASDVETNSVSSGTTLWTSCHRITFRGNSHRRNLADGSITAPSEPNDRRASGMVICHIQLTIAAPTNEGEFIIPAPAPPAAREGGDLV